MTDCNSKEETEDEETNAGIVFVLGAILLMAVLGTILFLLGMTKKTYDVVVRNTENGKEVVDSLRKFKTIEKACEFVRDYQWNSEEDHNAINILNLTRDEEVEDENGNILNDQIVYVVSGDKQVQAIINANDDEREAIGRILGYTEDDFEGQGDL